MSLFSVINIQAVRQKRKAFSDWVACGADAISRNVPPAGKLSVCEPERRFDFHDVMPLSQFNQLNVTLYHRHMQLEFSTRGSWLRVTNEGVIYYSSYIQSVLYCIIY